MKVIRVKKVESNWCWSTTSRTSPNTASANQRKGLTSPCPTPSYLPILTMSVHPSLLSIARRSTFNRPLVRQFSTSRNFASRLRQPGEPTGPNEPPPHTSAPRSKSPLKVWPFVLIFAAGSFMFKQIVDQRKGQYQAKGTVSGHSPSRP